MLAAARRAGAYGGKVCGAGGGGCLFCLGEPDRIPGDPRRRLRRNGGRLLDFTHRDRRAPSRRRAGRRREPALMSLDNLAIARVLAEIGDLLEIKGENPFKIRAYRNAAETIAHTAERIADLSPAAAAGDPRHRQGPRRARSASSSRPARSPITRSCSQEFPPTILDLLHLQGVGPKTVALLYRELGIRTLDDLERAAREGRLRDLKGMGAKKEALILKALEERARVTGRRLMAEAHETAAALLAALREHAPDADISPVGSLRRGCETCGDLDILAAGAPPSLMDAFTGYKLVERVLAHGETKSSVLLWGGFQADLRLVPRESLGAALQYFTGSKAAQHRAARSRDQARLQAERVRPLSESTTAQLVAGASEEEIYGRSASRTSRRSCARTAARSRPPSVPLAAPADARRPARRSAHAHDRHRRPRRRRDHGAGGAGRRALVHRHHRSQPGAGDGQRPRRAPRARARAPDPRARTTGSTASPCSPASSATSAPTARWISPTTAWPQLDIVIASVHSAFTQDESADDRPDPARDRMPVGRRPRPSDRPADPQAGGLST